MSWQELSGDSKVWIFASPNVLDEKVSAEIIVLAQSFVDNWVSHNTKVDGFFQLFKSQFLVFLANTSVDHVSGCSIDTLTAFVKSIEEKFDIVLLDRTFVFYVSESQIKSLDFREVEKLSIVEKESLFYVVANDLSTFLSDCKPIYR